MYRKLVAEHFSMRFNLLISVSHLNEVLNGSIERFHNENIRIEGIKVFHGNSLSGKTCWLYAPYDSINPVTGKKDYYGIPPARSQTALDSLFSKIHKAGLQIACHSNGDREIDMVMKAIEYAQSDHPAGTRGTRIEHCSITNRAMLERMRDDKIVPVFHCYMVELGDKLAVYGQERLEMIHPTRPAGEMKIHYALHSDSPKTKGSLVPGQLADLVVLDQDPTKIVPDNIHSIQVQMTLVGGKVVYQSTNP